MTQARLLGGRYQVGELLGYGGMAEVHRGRDLRLGRDVAIKMLRTDLARDDTFQLRFRREAQNAASLNHPAIVAVYDTGEERASTGESLPYIVMEFVNGRTLKEVLANEGRLMPRRALEITAEISAALEFSHRHGIIHRDIKPGNVMLTQTGQVKVMDFGIARALASGTSTMTQTSAVIGTAQYLSPEQARGESVDARSDVYATGCVLYELLCGQPPFVGDSPVSVAYQHVREDPKPPSLLNRDVPPPIDAIVLKALAKNPANRYQSAGEMRADVLRAAQGRPVYAEPVMAATEIVPGRPGPGGQRQQPARVGPSPRRRNQNMVVVALGSLAALAVIALVIGLIMSTRPNQPLVPGIVGMSEPDARNALKQRNLIPDPTPVDGTACGKQGVVKTQNPAQDTKVAEGSRVSYSYCSGPKNITIPANIAGQTKDQAKKTLEDLNLVPAFADVDSELALGTVVGSDPGPGSAVAERSTVTLKISRYNMRVVPNVSDGKFSKDEAIGALKSAGFNNINPVGETPTADPKLDGKVFSQNPDADTKQLTTTAITIAVYRYISPTTTPPTTTTPPPGN